MLFCLLAAFGCGGCGDRDRGLTSEQRASSDRLGEIAKRSGGEWDRLTPEDRNFLLNDLSHGNEQSARMLLLSASGKVGGKPVGGPRSTR
ncbi:MAG: hypothetical protein ACO1SX_21600 [Actinomycetota bacterium]